MKFSDIIGQEEAKNRLRAIVAEGRIPHAILLLGSEGCGALPLAYALAQYIECTGDKSAGDSCGTCPSCLKMKKLVHPDVHSIFPIVKRNKKDNTDTYLPEWREMINKRKYFSLQEWATTIQNKKQVQNESDEEDDEEGDDDMAAQQSGGKKKDAKNKQAIISKEIAEEIHGKLSMKPYEADKQILVMWKPEMMNASSSNSLLKILEEPPTDTIFILVSEDASEILPTVLSRTQTFKVPPIAEDALARHLQEHEGLEPDEAKNKAHISQGNMVTVCKMLEDSTDMDLNLTLFKKLMRSAYGKNIIQMGELSDEMRALPRDQVKNALIYFQRMIRESLVRNLNVERLNFLTPDEEAFLYKFARFVHINNVFQIVDMLDKAIDQVERNGNIKIIVHNLALNMTAKLKNLQRPQ